MYISGWMGKEDVHIHNGILFNHEKERYADIYNKMDIFLG